MGAGRKTETYSGGDNPQYWLGLPAAHISYVKNVYPGLTLFLFNYSDRKLHGHGIFEAVSHGKLNIDQCAWTSDREDTTPYPAQVRFRVRFQCEPLLEEQFGPIIAENYYEQKFFCFELDRAQTNQLISLFVPSLSRRAIPASSSAEIGVSGAQCVGKWSNLFKSSTGSSANTEHTNPKGDVDGSYSSCVNLVVTRANKGMETTADEKEKRNARSLVSSFGPSYSSVVKNMTSSSTMNKTSLLTNKASSHVSNEENFKGLPSELTHGHPASRRWEYACKEAEDVKCASKAIGFHQKNFNLGQEGSSAAANITRTTLSSSPSISHESKENFFNGSNLNTDVIDWDSLSFQVHLDGLNKILDEPMDNCDLDNENWNSEHGSLSMLPGLDNENHSWEIEEQDLKRSACGSSRVSAITGELIDDNGEIKDKLFMDLCQQEAGMTSEMGYSNFQALVAELLLEVKDLKLSQIKQGERMSSLEKELFESRKEIQHRRGQSTVSEADDFTSTLESCPDLEEKILVVGGSDGSSWLSTLDCYSVSKDELKLVCPMTSPRPYASVAMLRGEVYVIGGMKDGFLFGTVESYNREKNIWVGRPSLNHRKGNLASVSLNDKIFAVGGGDGFQPFQNVEMLDLETESWIPARSMLEQRFAPAAADINQALYVVGGYDGTSYLKSAERYDPRERSWTRLENMSTKRGCHSLVVQHEKLYAIGGYDGDTMVPTVEVFDPRGGRWRKKESMNQARGYCSSVVIGGAFYVLGGIKDEENFHDTVECYTEGYGWQLMEGKGLGKRSFFSAVAL